MNKSLLFITIILLLRMINSANSQVDVSTTLSVNDVVAISQNKVKIVSPNLLDEKKERMELQLNISNWNNNPAIASPSPVSSWAKENCAPIVGHQKNIFSQLKTTKPQYKVKKQIVIAIIDTGIDYTNPNLNSRIYRPRGWNLPLNFKGLDLIHQDFAPMDKDGHGTHVSGIIVGLFPEAKILPIKFYENSKRASMGVAIRVAVHMGANIINISGGGYGEEQYEKEAIQFAQEKGVLIISAAGNDHKNLDNPGDEFFPASYESDNIISVMANESNGTIASYSNFGINHADISALGTVRSYLPYTVSNSCGGYMSGTSQATPIITATVAMLWASHPELTYQEIKSHVLKGVDTSILLIAANKSQGTVNIKRTISGRIQK